MSHQIQSEQINELASALSKAQGEITPAIKDSKNPFFKSNYADLSSIWNACKEALSKNGLAILQTMDYLEGQLTLLTTLAHASGQWMRSYLPILTEKNNAQGIGSAITYMRRYALSAIVGITFGEEDDDGNGCVLPEKKKEELKSAAPISSEQASTIKKMLSQCDDIFVQQVQNFYFEKFNIKNWNQMTYEQYKFIYAKVSAKLDDQVAV